MKVKLSEFPKQPGSLPCCCECRDHAKRDCNPNPMNCIDFYIQNKAFIDKKLAKGGGDDTKK